MTKKMAKEIPGGVKLEWKQQTSTSWRAEYLPTTHFVILKLIHNYLLQVPGALTREQRTLSVPCYTLEEAMQKAQDIIYKKEAVASSSSF